MLNVDNEEFLIKDGVLLKYRGSSKDVTIPVGVKKIAAYAFKNYDARHNGMKSVILPEGLEIIGEGAFYNNDIKEINLPSTLTYIGERAFYNNSFDNVFVPKNVTYIGSEAFLVNIVKSIKTGALLSEIKSVTFLGRKVNIDSCFIGPNGLGTTINMGRNLNFEISSLPENNESSFTDASIIFDCKNASEQDINRALEKIYAMGARDVTLKNFDFSYEINAYKNMYIIIENSYTNESDRMRFHVSGKITENVRVLNVYASNRKDIVIPDFITTIAGNSLENKGLTSIVLPKNLITLYDVSFLGNDIEYLEVPKNVNGISEGTMATLTKLKKLKLLGKTMIKLSEENSETLTDIYMPYWYDTDTVYINNVKFQNKDNLTIHVDCSDKDITVDELCDYLRFNSDRLRIRNIIIYNYRTEKNLSLSEKMKIRKATKDFKSFSFATDPDILKPMEANLPKNETKYSSEIKKKLDEINELIKPLTDEDEKLVLDKVDEILESYEKEQEALKPKLDFKAPTANLTLAPTNIRDLNNSVLLKLDNIINIILGSGISVNLLNDIDKYSELLANGNTEFVVNPQTTDEKTKYIIAFINKYDYIDIAVEFRKLLNDTGKTLSGSLVERINSVTTLTLEYTNYELVFKEKIDEIYTKAYNYKYLYDGIKGIGDYEFAHFFKDIRMVVNELDNQNKEKFTNKLDKLELSINDFDLSMPLPDLELKVRAMVQPILEELNDIAQVSVKLKKIIESIAIGQRIMNGEDVEISESDLINQTIKEILAIVPAGEEEKVKDELNNLLNTWSYKLATGDIEIAPGFKNLGKYNEILYREIEVCQALIDGENPDLSELNDDDIIVKTFIQIIEKTPALQQVEMQGRLNALLDSWRSKLYKGLIVVKTPDGKLAKSLETMAVLLTIFKDFQNVLISVENYNASMQEFETYKHNL